MLSCCSCWWEPVWPEPGGLKQFHNPGDFLLIGIMKPITNIKSCSLKRQPEQGQDAHGPHSTPPVPQRWQPQHLQVSDVHTGPSSCGMSSVGSQGRWAGGFGARGVVGSSSGCSLHDGFMGMDEWTKLDSHHPPARRCLVGPGLWLGPGGIWPLWKWENLAHLPTV